MKSRVRKPVKNLNALVDANPVFWTGVFVAAVSLASLVGIGGYSLCKGLGASDNKDFAKEDSEMQQLISKDENVCHVSVEGETPISGFFANYPLPDAAIPKSAEDSKSFYFSASLSDSPVSKRFHKVELQTKLREALPIDELLISKSEEAGLLVYDIKSETKAEINEAKVTGMLKFHKAQIDLDTWVGNGFLVHPDNSLRQALAVEIISDNKIYDDKKFSIRLPQRFFMSPVTGSSPLPPHSQIAAGPCLV